MVLRFGIAAHVLEWQYGNGRLVWERQCRSRACCFPATKAYVIDPHRPRDIFKLLFARIYEGNIDLALSIFLHSTRYADAARLCQSLQPSSYIHAVPEDVPAVDDDVADVDADPKLDPSVRLHSGISLAHAALDFGGAAHRIDRACKLDQCAVALSLDDAAMVLRDLGINKGFA